MADVVLKVVTGKEFGGGRRQEEGVSLGLFHPNAIEARDRSRGPPRALHISPSLIHYMRAAV